MSSIDDSFSSDEIDSPGSSGSVSVSESESLSFSDFEDTQLCAQLLNDIEHVKQSFGIGTIIVKDPVLDNVDITLLLGNIPINRQTSKAWRVNLKEPIVISLKGISASGYLHGNAPKVEVCQSEQMGIGSQLTFIVGQFCKKEWDKNSALYYQSRTPAEPDKPIENQVEIELLEMGFTKTQSYVASQECANIQQAIQYLIDNPNPRRSKRLRKAKEPVKQSLSQTTQIPSSKSGSDEFEPNYSHGMFCEILRYVQHRIPALNKYCVMCDQTHIFGGSLLKPAVCRRELCAFTFQQFNIVSDAELATHAEVVDLLVCMAKAASNSPRAQSILNPFPTLFDPDSVRQQIVLDPENPDYNLAKKLFNKIQVPCIVEHKDSLSFSLLQWVVNSNRTHLVKLPDQYHIKTMDTPFQYIMLSATPEKEAKFQKLKKKHGSQFAFHGSRVENWYSILRNGLRNASGTNLQLNGAAYGNGIYLATNAATSFGYSLRGGGYNVPAVNVKPSNNDFIEDGKWICLALCEVIQDGSIKKSGGIWVAPNEDCVVTRFFFVYKYGQYSSGAQNAQTTSQAFNKQVEKALTCFE